VAQILGGLRDAEAEGADLCIFPELAITATRPRISS